jgi:acetyltransferase-like isoleucine patch superfamily enzyme
MRRAIILGNSGAARECCWLLREVMREKSDLVFGGFLAFEGYAGNLRELAPYALGTDDDYVPEPDDEFIIGIGLPALRLKAFRKWKARGARFMTLMHPGVIMMDNAALGEGNILAYGCHISCNTVFGDANYLNGGVVIGHDARIGDGNFFGPVSMVMGDAAIGSGNSFGVHSVTLAGVKIGNNNTIAPGAYVYKGCGNGCLLAGNPALRME